MKMLESNKKNNDKSNEESIMIIDSFGHKYVTKGEISRGGQGVVYYTNDPLVVVKIALDENKKEMTDKNTSLNEISKRNEDFFKQLKLPLPKKINITFPFSTLKNAVGYTMRLMEDMTSFENAIFFNYSTEQKTNYKNKCIKEMFCNNTEIEVMLNDYIGTGGIRRRLNAFYLCSVILARIHAQGLVYCDFSDKNVFISKKNDDDENKDNNDNYYENDHVWLIDADNVNYQEVTIKSAYYTPEYEAPEVYIGNGASFYSDCFAFSVSLFKNLFMFHPFKGYAFYDYDGDAEEADDLLQKGEFAYILDEDDESNPARMSNNNSLVDAVIDNLTKNSLDENIKPLFDRTFIDGKFDLRKRPSMMEWTESISKALDNQLVCSECKLPYINKENARQCSWCDNINNVFVVKSYSSNNRILRNFRREFVNGNTLKVPLRVIKGTDVTNLKDNIMSVSFKADTLIIKAINDEYPLYTDFGKRIYGSYEISMEKFKSTEGAKTIELFSDDISCNIRYKLEVGII